MLTAWFYWNFLPHPDRFDYSENRDIAIFRHLECDGLAWGWGSLGICNQRLRGKDMPGGHTVCLLLLCLTHGRFRRLVARLKLHLCVMLLIFETDMPFHLLIKKKKNPRRKQRPDVDLHAPQVCLRGVGLQKEALLSCSLSLSFCEFPSAVLWEDSARNQDKCTMPSLASLFSVITAG